MEASSSPQLAERQPLPHSPGTPTHASTPSPSSSAPTASSSPSLSTAATPQSLAVAAEGGLLSLAAIFLPGAAQGATTVLLGHPLDTAKTRMQAAGPNAQRSALSTITAMTRHEGLRSLYRGCTPPLLMEGVKRSLQFALWDLFRAHHARVTAAVEGGSDSDGGGISSASAVLAAIGANPFLSGAVAGGVGTTIGCPMHVLKIRTQYQTREGTRNAWTCAVSIAQHEGLRGFYRGYKYNLLKDVCFAGAYLGLYGWLRERWAADAAGRTFLAGATASAATWVLLYPLDTVKTLVQSGQQHRLSRALLRDPRRLYRGLAASLLKAGPVSGVAMCVYEWARAATEAWR